MQINDPQTLVEVTACFERYEAAVATNDTATLNELFWSSDRALRYGYGENLYGHDAIAAFRNSRTPSTQAKQIRNCMITAFGTGFATANIDFIRGRRQGRQSQTWVRMPEGWRIVAAHVSYLASPVSNQPGQGGQS